MRREDPGRTIILPGGKRDKADRSEVTAASAGDREQVPQRSGAIRVTAGKAGHLN